MKILLLLLFLIIPSLTHAQFYKDIPIPTRVADVSKKYLLADVYANDSTTPKPVILIQTPYNKLYYRLALATVIGQSGAGIPYDTSKYNYVFVDWRGFYANKDVDITPYNRGLDGYDIVEWIAIQPWCDGKIGTWGGSALGQIQFQTAAQKPPHLVCAAPFIKDFKTKYEDFYYGGVYRKEHIESLVKLGFTTEQLILSHPTYDNVWKITENQTDNADQFSVPMLVCSGWFDHYPSDVLRAFDDIITKSDPNVRDKHKLLFGPWQHTSLGFSKQGVLEFPDAQGQPTEMGMAFFGFYLRGEKTNWEGRPTVRYYQMGENTWKTVNNWKNVGSHTSTLYFREGKKLSFEEPPINIQAVPPDTLIADSKNPVPTIGGSLFNTTDKTIETGPQDVQSLLTRKDVLAYSTETIINDISITGKSRVKVKFTCNRTDADISVRLCDVYPDGRWVILTQGIKRLRFRRSLTSEILLTPNASDSATIELNDLGMTFLKGHKLGLILSGSNYPMFDINLNNGGKLYTAGDSLTAETLIFSTNGEPSVFEFESDKVVSVKENEIPIETETIIISPNPTTDQLTVSFGELQSKGSISLIDILGNQVLSQSFNDQTSQSIISTKLLPNGVYGVVLNINGNVKTKTIQIVR
ncbi:MAG: CocE/NonD family hydrolase [Bacteroidetes bacterium]|nr:CocE/NonD family hydrolase [Bacteroidota bacterium]